MSSWHRAAWAIVASTSVGVLACGSSPAQREVEKEAIRCGASDDIEGVRVGHGAERAAEIGVLDGGRFVPLANGDALRVVRGHQGGFMVTPALRVVAERGDPEAVCCNVVVTNTVGTREVQVSPGMHADVMFVGAGDWLQSGYLNDLLAYSHVGLEGAAMTIEATLEAREFASSVTIDVSLEVGDP